MKKKISFNFKKKSFLLYFYRRITRPRSLQHPRKNQLTFVMHPTCVTIFTSRDFFNLIYASIFLNSTLFSFNYVFIVEGSERNWICGERLTRFFEFSIYFFPQSVGITTTSRKSFTSLLFTMLHRRRQFTQRLNSQIRLLLCTSNRAGKLFTTTTQQILRITLQQHRITR